MADQIRRDIDEWRLGIEAGEPHPPPPPPPAPEPRPRDLSAERLGAPLYVLTVEHLCWAVIALYAILTRLGGLGFRPLSSLEASQALFASDLANHGMSALAQNPPASGWLDPLRAGVFLVLGPSDFGARIVAAILGLLLIGAGFSMRRHLGRAGALAFAAMLTLSPSLTYFSRSTSAAVPAIALVVIGVALVFALVGVGDTVKVVGLAVAIAFALSTEPIVFPLAAMFVAILILMGLWELIFRRNSMIRIRVWWERRSAHLIFCSALVIGLFAVLESGFGRRNLFLPIIFGAMRQWLPVLRPQLRGGLNFYLPAFAFYEFTIAIFGALGLLAFLAFQLRTRIATVAFLWTIFATAFFLADPAQDHSWLVMMIVPAALMGAAAIDRLHHSDAWEFLRYPIAVLVLLTLYLQLDINFVRVAPEPSEASWAHHLLLFWTEPTTTTLAKEEFSHAERAVSDRGTVFLAEPNPVERWYLRDLKPADSAANADLIVSPATTEKPPNLLESSEFTLDESWNPTFAGLAPGDAVKYFFTQRAWGEVTASEIRVDVRGPTPPTPAPAPSASPSTSPAPAVAVSGTPTPTPTPTEQPTSSTTATVAETPVATSTPTSIATDSASPMPSPANSPAPTGAP